MTVDAEMVLLSCDSSHGNARCDGDAVNWCDSATWW